MKIVYSYWSKGKVRNWYNTRYKWYTLALSVYYSNLHYNNSNMVTTSEMKDFFEKIEIPFSNITVELDNINPDPRFWVAGKMKAYEIQTEPFIHLDNDFIPYEKFEDFETVLVQNIESFEDEFINWGYKHRLDRCRENFKNTNYSKEHSLNMGVYGNKNLKLNKKYCNFANKIYSENKEYLESQSDLKAFCTILEQYNLACATKLKQVSEVKTDFLHLTSDKYNNKFYNQIEQEVKERLPNVYKNINTYVSL